MTNSPTKKEQRILEVLKAYQDKNKSPSYQELMDELGYKSSASIFRFIVSLKKKGLLENSGRSWRNIQIKKQNDPSQVEIIGRIVKPRTPELLKKTEFMSVPKDLMPLEGSLYGLRIEDASFLDEHLLPGDLILVDPSKPLEEGSLILASTTKSFIGHAFDDGEILTLRTSPYNPSLTSISLKREDVEIWGVIVALIRKYL